MAIPSFTPTDFRQGPDTIKLFEAIENNDLTAFNNLVKEKGLDWLGNRIKASVKSKDSIIEKAIDSLVPGFVPGPRHKRSFEIAKQILSHIEAKNSQNSSEKTPLHLAVEKGNLLAVEILINNGANTNIRDAQGNTPQHIAAHLVLPDRQIQSLIKLLTRNEHFDPLTNHEGRDAVQEAAHFGNTAALQPLFPDDWITGEPNEDLIQTILASIKPTENKMPEIGTTDLLHPSSFSQAARKAQSTLQAAQLAQASAIRALLKSNPATTPMPPKTSGGSSKKATQKVPPIERDPRMIVLPETTGRLRKKQRGASQSNPRGKQEAVLPSITSSSSSSDTSSSQPTLSWLEIESRRRAQFEGQEKDFISTLLSGAVTGDGTSLFILKNRAHEGCSQSQWSLGVSHLIGSFEKKSISQAEVYFRAACLKENEKEKFTKALIQQMIKGDDVVKGNGLLVIAFLLKNRIFSSTDPILKANLYKMFLSIKKADGFQMMLQKIAVNAKIGIPDWFIFILAIAKGNNIAGRILEMEAQNGIANFQYALYRCARSGIGLQKNNQIAFRSLKEALCQYHQISLDELKRLINARDPDALHLASELGDMYLKGLGVEMSYPKALMYFRLAAAQNNAYAQNILGTMYSKGQGVEQSNTEALKYLHLAAAQNNATAQYNLGVMYVKGLGVEQSNADALKYFHRAAKQNNASALFGLGCMYFNGQGVQQSNADARMYFRLAADQGSEMAKKNLDSMAKKSSK